MSTYKFTETSSIIADALETSFKASYAMPPGWIVRDEAQELEQAKKEPRNLPLCGYLMWTNEVTVVGGDDRAGKTKFIDAWAWRALEGKEFIPGMDCAVPAHDLRIGGLDFELTAGANATRNSKRLEKWRGTGRYVKLRPDYAEPDEPGKDLVDTMLEVIEAFVWTHNRNVILWDNVMAAIGDISDNATYIKLHKGLKAIIERRKKAGFWLAIIVFVHLTKNAQDRREEKGGDAMSRKSDFRGAGAMQITAGSVFEVRPSGSVENLALLILFNTRHGKALVQKDEGTAWAFQMDHTEGHWDMHYDHVACIKDHFGKTRHGTASVDVADAANIPREIQDQIISLHGKGWSINAIHKELKARVDTKGKSPSRQAITTMLKARGLESNGKKFGEQ
jgi:hypothetical protein